MCVVVWPCDRLVTCPGCTPPHITILFRSPGPGPVADLCRQAGDQHPRVVLEIVPRESLTKNAKLKGPNGTVQLLCCG